MADNVGRSGRPKVDVADWSGDVRLALVSGVEERSLRATKPTCPRPKLKRP